MLFALLVLIDNLAFSTPQSCFVVAAENASIFESRFFEDDKNIEQIANVDKLSVSVLAFTLKDGRKVVLRFDTTGLERGSTLNSIPFERFASNVVSLIHQPIPVPKQTTLSKAFRNLVISKFQPESKEGTESREYEQKRLDFLVNRSQINSSVASFYNLEIGEDYIDRTLASFSGSNRYKRLSMELRQELAQLYCSAFILGITDFHDNNWLTDGRSVMPIDLANQTWEFNEGKPIPQFNEIDFPVEIENQNIFNHLKMIKGELSQEFRLKISNLDNAQLKQIAKDSNFSLSATALKGMLLRRDVLLKNLGDTGK